MKTLPHVNRIAPCFSSPRPFSPKWSRIIEWDCRLAAASNGMLSGHILYGEGKIQVKVVVGKGINTLFANVGEPMTPAEFRQFVRRAELAVA